MLLPVEKPFSNIAAAPLSNRLKELAKRKIAECVSQASKLGYALPMPTVSFDLRGKVAGSAYLMRNHIRVNPILFAENEEEFLKQTVPHEVAHLMAHVKHGFSIKPHGPEWQAAMLELGLEPRRCHDYDVTNAAVGGARKFVCKCNSFVLTGRARISRALNGSYICKSCRAVLKPADSAPEATSSLQTAPAVARPTPPAVKPPVRPPSAAMLSFAQSLATQKGLVVPAEALISFEACSSFIEQAKQCEARPTEKQVRYAKYLSEKTGNVLTPDVLVSARRLSRWIDEVTASN